MSTALGYVRERTGDVDAAGRLVADGIEASLPVTARPNLIRSIEVTGLLATLRREGATAARFFGAAAELHDLWGIPHVPLEAPIIAEAEDEMHLLLGRNDYERAAAEGGSLSLEDAAAEAARWLRNTTGALR